MARSIHVDMQLPETKWRVNKVVVTDDYTNFSKYAQPELFMFMKMVRKPLLITLFQMMVLVM